MSVLPNNICGLSRWNESWFLTNNVALGEYIFAFRSTKPTYSLRICDCLGMPIVRLKGNESTCRDCKLFVVLWLFYELGQFLIALLNNFPLAHSDCRSSFFKNRNNLVIVVSELDIFNHNSIWFHKSTSHFLWWLWFLPCFWSRFICFNLFLLSSEFQRLGKSSFDFFRKMLFKIKCWRVCLFTNLLLLFASNRIVNVF